MRSDQSLSKSAATGDQLVWELAEEVETQAHTGTKSFLSTRKPKGHQEEADLPSIYRMAGTIWQHIQSLLCETANLSHHRSAYR